MSAEHLLFDSSGIINLCSIKRIEGLLRGWTLDIAFYELGNSVWNQVFTRHELSESQGRTVLDALISVLKMMRKIAEIDALAALELAVREGLRFYDASYVEAALENKMKLVTVTDDQKLYRAAKNYVKCLHSQDI